MRSKADPKIAEMGTSIFMALGYPEILDNRAFKAAFAQEAHTRGIFQNKYVGYRTPQRAHYNALFTAVRRHVKNRIQRQVIKKIKQEAENSHRRTRRRVVPLGMKQQLHLF